MTEYPTELLKTDFRSRAMATIGAQPIAIAAAALLLVVSGICAILLWRIASGQVPEQDRVAAGRQVQARVAQTSEQIMEKTKGIALSQQESIDQLQSLQDQLNSIQQLVTAQRNESKRLADQVGEIGGNLDGLRQALASAQAADTAERPAARSKPAATSHRRATKPRATRKRAKAKR